MVLSKPSMCKLDLTHLRIGLQNFALITHPPQPGFESFYNHQKGSTGTEVGKEGEGTSAKAAAELVVTPGAQALAMALDLRRGRARLGGMAGLDFSNEHWAK
jgi:hypothetical protein